MFNAVPFVSVVIPNYNHASFLKKRIESVINQTYNYFEIIILDDCSTDSSREVIELYKQHIRVSHIVINEANSGSPFVQWQKGFELVKGDIIWIAESDDYADLNFLETLVPFFKENVGVVYCDSNVIDVNNIVHLNYYKKFRNERFKTDKWNNSYTIDGIIELRQNLFFECTINNMSATLFKKELLKEVDFNVLKSFRYCGDWFFLVTLAKNSKIVYVPDALNYFKYGTNNFKKGTKSVLNYFKERFIVRYFFWKEMKEFLTDREQKELLVQLASEMKIQVNETLKGQSNPFKLVRMFKQLNQLNRKLFRKHFAGVLKSYLWKS